MECPYPDCKFVAAPGQAAEDGVCPGCDRPYKSQPTPLESDMSERNMPAPGEEDMGGNPLQEGILGDYQNRGVRDESYASVRRDSEDLEPDIEIPAEVTAILPPDPESIRPDKKRMDRKADFLNSLEDVAAPVVGGTAGFLVGGPAGAAAGAGLAGGAMDALQGEGAGKALGTGIEDAALGGGAGLGAAAVAEGATADAAASGSTRGGIGSLMKSAWSKVPTTQLRNAYLMHSALGDASQAMQSPMAPPSGMAPTPSVEPPSYYSHTAAKNDTPTSHGEIPSNDTDDPEEVDFKERNDGDDETKGLDLGQSVNDIGGTDLGPDDFFSPDSDALGSLAQLLPKVLEFALGDQSAEGDPEMEDLHQKLEHEMPGYMDHANDDHGVKLITMIVKGTPGESGDDDHLQDNDEPHDPIADTIQASVQAHVESALRPGLDTHCGRCGNVIDASSKACPQCGMGNMGHQPQPTNPDFITPQQMMDPPAVTSKTAVAMDGQGPNTDEQKAAVAQLLQEEGRGEEIPNMIVNPQEYADELAEVTGQEDPPEDIGQEGPPPPVVPAEQQGEMPVPGMSTPAPTMARAIAKYAGTVDVAAETCPNCGSHSTGYQDPEGGEAGCKTCGHHWKTKPLVEVTSAHEDEANPLGVPLAEAEGPQDVENEKDSAHSWVDSEGEPLHVGQSYEMYSANYEIPDRIRIDKVKPDVINYTMIGEYGLNHGTEMTHEEAEVEQVSFVPADNDVFNQGEPGPNEDLEQNMDDIARPGPGEETDASTPHMMMSHKQGAGIGFPDGGTQSLTPPQATCPNCNGEGFDRTGGVCFDCQGSGQVEDPSPGPLQPSAVPYVAKTADFDDINGPNGPNVDPTYEMDPNMCPICQGEGYLHDGIACPDCMGTGVGGESHPETLERQFNIPSVEHPHGPHTGSTETGPDWMLQEGFVSTAGAHMTPWEQRGFIEEDGVARNADKLNLGGTHYERDPLDDSFLFGL